MKKGIIVTFFVLLVLVADQTLKIWVKTSLPYAVPQNIMGLSWATLNFVENPGMAFGLEFGGEYGKLALSLFRLVAIGFLIYYLRILIRRGESLGLVISFGAILAGAIGNMIDCAFYGMIFSASGYHHDLARLFPIEGGYGTFLHGKVVDMLHFPLVKNSEGEVLFFSPVFNLADAAISCGVASILLFHRAYFNAADEPVQKTPETTENSIENAENTESIIENTVDTEGGLK